MTQVNSLQVETFMLATETRLSNAPESEGLSFEDVTVFENARSAVMLLKKTFETWVTIMKAVVRARDIADRRGGGKTFMRLIEQQGLAKIINKTTASNCLRIMQRLPDVVRWRGTLTEKEQIEWAAPTTILKRCPIFQRPGLNDLADKPPSKAKQISMELAKALEEIERFKKRQADGSLFDLRRDTAKDIVTAILGNISEHKAKEIATGILTTIKGKRTPAG
jgi:hypothetical protein